jgi:hypothetical protein
LYSDAHFHFLAVSSVPLALRSTGWQVRNSPTSKIAEP